MDDLVDSEPTQAWWLTWQEAEYLARDWMEYFLFTNAYVTDSGPDQGIDIRADGGVAQVKCWQAAVGIKEVQRAAGLAQSNERVVFFSTGGYTEAARAWGEASQVAMFKLTQGSISAINAVADQMVRFAFENSSSDSKRPGKVVKDSVTIARQGADTYRPVEIADHVEIVLDHDSFRYPEVAELADGWVNIVRSRSERGDEVVVTAGCEVEIKREMPTLRKYPGHLVVSAVAYDSSGRVLSATDSGKQYDEFSPGRHLIGRLVLSSFPSGSVVQRVRFFLSVLG